MVGLDLEPQLDGVAVQIQEESALEIALPQVFEQPPLTVLQRDKLLHVEALVARIFKASQASPPGGLGSGYQALVNEFYPLLAWAGSCWDFLLSTEGCRFVPRSAERKLGVRGDYRVVACRDFSRLLHVVFHRCVLDFAQEPQAPSLGGWLRERFWPDVLTAYRQLEHPPDPRQRRLSPYSYLRCVPYRFLNEFHHDLVYSTVHRLPTSERRAVEVYFFHFYTASAAAEAVGCSEEECRAGLRQGLTRLLIHDRLVYCLLRQIERY